MSCCQNTVCRLCRLQGRREAVTVDLGTSNDSWQLVLARISPAWFSRAALFHLPTARKGWPFPLFRLLTWTAPQSSQLLPAEACIQQGSSTLYSHLLLRSSWFFSSAAFPSFWFAEEQRCSSSTKCQPSARVQAGPSVIDLFVYLRLS